MHSIEWGFLVAAYLFLGGLSAGILFVSALLTCMRPDDGRARQIERYGALIAPWPVTVGTLLLVLDLGRKFRFYKLMLHLNLTSPMSLGAWLLALFIPLTLVYLYSWLSADDRRPIFALVPKKRLGFVHALNRDISGWRRRLAMTALPASIAVGAYTGVLLGSLQARPFWNSSLVAQIFLLSGLSAGTALLILIAHSRKIAAGRDLEFLYAFDAGLLVLELLLVLFFVVQGRLSLQPVRQAMELLFGGGFAALFWIVFVGLGLIVPIAVAAHELAPRLGGARPVAVPEHRLAAVSAALVLAGGFVLRYVFVYLGQISSVRHG